MLQRFFLTLVLSLSLVAEASAQQVLGGQNLTGKAPVQTIGNEANWYLDFASGNFWGPKTSGQWGASATGNMFSSSVNGFGGLQFAIAPGSISNPSGSMSGYVQGDTIVPTCIGVTFNKNPLIGVGAVSGGAITTAVVIDGGETTGVVPSGAVQCSQASTNTQSGAAGAGTGYQFTAQLGLVAAALSIPGLATGGGVANRNLYINQSSNRDNVGRPTGAENFFAGDGAGAGTSGNTGFSTLLGATAACCGTNAVMQGTTGVGTDVFRNSNGSFGATAVGAASAQSEGNYVAVLGWHTLQTATGAGHVMLGPVTGNSIATGVNDAFIQANNSGTDLCSNGDESNTFAMCLGSGRVLTLTGGGTPSTSVFKVSGLLTVAGIPTSAGGGGLYVCVDSTGTIYKKASCP